jgi:chorismate dehydratase
MNGSEPLPKLRMAPPESPEDLARRYEREQRAVSLSRERALEESTLVPFRVGSVPYLNAVPLTRGLEDEIIFAPPSQLGEMLRNDQLEAALVSVTEVLFNDRYNILDGIAVASLGEVKSVFLAHRRPIESATEIHCDPASLTSVNLLRVLLAERGLHPRFVPLLSYEREQLPDFVLLIGNPAIDYLRGSVSHEIWDLGAAWFELTRLPFVYAVWALRRGLDDAVLRQKLREARDFGLDTLDHIVASRDDYDLDFRRDYLQWHIHYHLGADEKRGLARFVELLRRHGTKQVYDPVFVR